MKYSFAPLADDRVAVLVLGSLPGERSLAVNEYYGHPRNRFWHVIAGISGHPLPLAYAEKRDLLSRLGIGLWDVARGANREGSLDSAIRDEEPNDIPRFIAAHPRLRLIAFNGQKPARLFNKYFQPAPGIVHATLPGTSPANAAWHLDRLCQAWHEALSVALPDTLPARYP
ncbi:MAG: DNA-deoxyinosine glycosylase [Odoribacteraceae bacterium]|jgi:hypoxanthine-DNA glycosylase|nr:DNA-deoxyinosine glycosylase [Odoribacteraceae bacterium]